MFNKLLFASIIALSSFTAATQTADARSIMVKHSPVVFSIDNRLKSPDLGDMNEYHFELQHDGTWSYIETKKQSIVKRGSGKLSRDKVQMIERLIRQKWTIQHAEITCMAFAATQQIYNVDGKAVWTDEMCGSEQLDSATSKRFEKVMKVITPIIAGMVK